MSFDRVDDLFLIEMVNSYERWTGDSLLDDSMHAKLADDPKMLEKLLWHAPYGLVAHGTGADPIFCYGNEKALTLFGYTQTEFLKLPSRYSAELDNRDERAALLKQVEEFGFAHGYSGVRVSKNGQRFMIEDATVWNVHNSHNTYLGQAAIIRGYRLFTS